VHLAARSSSTAQYIDTQTTYGSGLGTAASPLVVQNGWDADVNDEIVVGGGTDYLKNETRRIKTRLSSTQFVLCSTPGGAEVALAHSHAVGAHIGNLTRNSIVKANNNARGFYADNASNEISNFNYSRMEYSECNSGKALTLQRNSLSTIDGLVLCNNPSTGRTTLLMPTNAIPQTNTGIILYNTRGNNYSGQSGIGFQGSSNKTLNNCLHFNGPSSTDTCAFISLNGSSTSNVFNNCHSYGANAGNSSSGYAIGAFSSSGNSFNNCSVNGARQNATYLAIGDSNVFTNCNFGMMANNTVDVANASDSLNKALYENCNFGSTTLITNYLNTLAGTEIVFADMNGTPYNNAIYSTNGLKSTTGPGLADTTLTPLSNRTERLEPLTAPGVKYRYKQLASPAQIFTTYGRLWVNAAALAEAGFVVTVDLYLPGLVEGVDTPSATVTMTKTTTANSANAIYLLSSFYSGTRPRFANIVITAKNPNAIASTYAYVGDILNGTNNITNFSTQDRGAPSEVMFEQNGDPGALAEAARQAILGDTSTWPINSKGNDIMEAAESAELASMK
jgi:hypothetical protein